MSRYFRMIIQFIYAWKIGMGNQAEFGAARIGSECFGKAQHITAMPKACQLADQLAHAV